MSSTETLRDAGAVAVDPLRRHSLKKNAASLFAIQLANQALPLVTLPIVTRALGAEEFGRMSFVLAVIAYATLIADYGFNLTATAAISVKRQDRKARSRIFWETMSVKALLAIACGITMILLLSWVPRAANDASLYVVAFGVVAASVLTPNWYYHGVERLPALGLMTLATRAAAVPATLWLVRSPDDTLLALAITVASGLGASVLSLGGLWVRREVSFFSPALTNIRASLADGWHVFVATAAISLYTNSNTVLLGILAGNRAVALFVAAEKVVKASFLILTPISQSLYPRLSYLMAHDRPQAFVLIRRSAWIVGSVAVALLLGIAGLAPWVIPLLFGPGFADAVPLLQLMSVLPLAIGLSNLLGVQTMLPLGMKREVSVVVIGCGAVNVALLILLVPHWGARGAAISVALTEILVAGAMGAALHWRRHAA